MNKILNSDYSYNYMSFTGSKGKYQLVGTKCDYGADISECIDTFKNEQGIFLEVKRKIIMKQQNEGLITPLEESRVIVKQYSKKDEKLRRAI